VSAIIYNPLYYILESLDNKIHSSLRKIQIISSCCTEQSFLNRCYI